MGLYVAGAFTFSLSHELHVCFVTDDLCEKSTKVEVSDWALWPPLDIT